MRPSFVLFLVTSIFASPLLGDPLHEHRGGDPTQLGSVRFENSCAEEVQPHLSRALAMLHSFWYDEAGRQFHEVAERDETCAIAWWGVALSHWQPLWEPRGPGGEALALGRAAILAALEAGGASEREQGLIEALARFYLDSDTVDHLDRVLAYERAMEELFERYPHDTEVRAFYALSLQASATSLPADKTYARQRKSGELLLPLFDDQPDHPGAAHYIIHAFDYPPLAARALDAARRYAKIAPDSPHAQHMPSHIFTRLGLWDESIESNRNVIRVARKYGIVGEELHAVDYLVFAHLQKGEDDEALRVIEAMPEPQPGAPLYFAAIFSHAVVPARYAIERGEWEEAARLPEPQHLPGGRYAWADATIHYARALGAARIGDVEQARAEVEKIAQFKRTLDEHKEDYWAKQVQIQKKSAKAWLAFEDGRHDDALELMKAAAALEDTTDKHPVTPGHVIAARDLLGQMLMELDRPDEALEEFRAVLAAEPGRFGALYRAARAADLAGMKGQAREHYAQLIELAPGSSRKEIEYAKTQLASPIEAISSH
jgi:tetratricopeptide (TPR) repeat protein